MCPSAFSTRTLRTMTRGSVAQSTFAGRAIFRILIAFLVVSAGTLYAQTYTDLYNFLGKPDGCCPQYPSVMAQGRDGNLYGITTAGGANNLGSIFKITPTGTHTALYSFDTAHGSTPIGGLVLGLDGNIYGTTELDSAHGFGNIFKITPAGVLTVIYDFTGGSDGGFPVSALIIGQTETSMAPRTRASHSG